MTAHPPHYVERHMLRRPSADRHGNVAVVPQAGCSDSFLFQGQTHRNRRGLLRLPSSQRPVRRPSRTRPSTQAQVRRPRSSSPHHSRQRQSGAEFDTGLHSAPPHISTMPPHLSLHALRHMPTQPQTRRRLPCPPLPTPNTTLAPPMPKVHHVPPAIVVALLTCRNGRVPHRHNER